MVEEMIKEYCDAKNRRDMIDKKDKYLVIKITSTRSIINEHNNISKRGEELDSLRYIDRQTIKLTLL